MKGQPISFKQAKSGMGCVCVKAVKEETTEPQKKSFSWWVVNLFLFW